MDEGDESGPLRSQVIEFVETRKKAVKMRKNADSLPFLFDRYMSMSQFTGVMGLCLDQKGLSDAPLQSCCQQYLGCLYHRRKLDKFIWVMATATTRAKNQCRNSKLAMDDRSITGVGSRSDQPGFFSSDAPALSIMQRVHGCSNGISCPINGCSNAESHLIGCERKKGSDF